MGNRNVRDEKLPAARTNEDIKAPIVRVVDSNGTMLGIFPIKEAREKALEQEKDLVEIAPQANPPVCKIIDYGKYVYEQHKREKEQRKKTHTVQLKEIRFKAGTDTHDFDFKTRHARDFLIEGDKVKASVMFRGREIQHMEFGEAILRRFVEQLDDVSKVDQAIRTEGRNMSVTLAPDKEKQKKSGVLKSESSKQQSSKDSLGKVNSSSGSIVIPDSLLKQLMDDGEDHSNDDVEFGENEK